MSYFRFHIQVITGLPLKLVKNLPAMQETLVLFLGWEDPLEKGWLSSPVFLGFPCGSADKNLPAMRETWVRSVRWEDPLEKERATHSSILACRIPRTEEPGGLGFAVYSFAAATDVPKISFLLSLVCLSLLINNSLIAF